MMDNSISHAHSGTHVGRHAFGGGVTAQSPSRCTCTDTSVHLMCSTSMLKDMCVDATLLFVFECAVAALHSTRYR